VGAPDAEAAMCMAGALTFFETLGSVRERLALNRAAWSNLMVAAKMMEESLGYLEACDPDLPVKELKLLLDNFNFAIRTRNRVLVRATVREIERLFRRRYGEPLAALDWKVIETVRRELRSGELPE
jgi:hypothetical protein